MSVVNSILIYGWQVTEEEKEEINKYFDYKYEDKFCYSNYYAKDPNIIFGEEILNNNNSMGYALEIDKNKLKKITKKEIKKLSNLLNECGLEEMAKEEPQLYLIARLT